MELQYIKALKEHNLRVNDLPEDAQTGISEINKILKGFSMVEKRGLKPTQSAMKKLRTLDKWVYYEILDYLHDTDKNDDDMPVDADDVLDDLNDNKKQDDDKPQVDSLGLEIDSELDQLYSLGKKQFSIDEIKTRARKAYKEIWDNYEPGDENGIVTSKYSFIENEQELFELKLK